MATKTADVHIRINPTLKSQAEDYFEENGTTMSQAVEQFLAWTVKHKKTPMRLKHRANILDLSRMSKTEIETMLKDSEKEVKTGKHYTINEVRREMATKYGFEV
ncbi:type II toxin-antitoxin system RelB/DinJ family antitoxin [Candidatus Saccharibacteria bacterium]|nr:type II toxin-antitoxin system RelB/DinJ family antitoxin [Candidatus Saccharibacteria bacterium]